METFLTIVGGAIAVCCAVIAAFVAIAAAFAMLEPLLRRIENGGERRARARLLETMMSNSYWFSEHPPTAKLLHDIALEMAGAPSCGISQLRDDWRKSMNAAAKTGEPTK